MGSYMLKRCWIRLAICHVTARSLRGRRMGEGVVVGGSVDGSGWQCGSALRGY